MGSLSTSVASTTEDASIAASRHKVCIHVLQEGYSDYRLMRGATALSEAGFSVTIVDVEVERSCSVEENPGGLRLEPIVVPIWHKSRKFEPLFFIVAVKTFILSILRLIHMHANKLFDYLMAGLPVLTSNIGAVVDIVKSYDVGQIVTSVEPGAIGAAINAMLANDTALHRMRQMALEAAKNELNWEKESSQLVHLYEELLVAIGKK